MNRPTPAPRELCCTCKFFFFMDIKASMGRCLNIGMQWPYTERGRHYTPVGPEFSCERWELRGARCPDERRGEGG